MPDEIVNNNAPAPLSDEQRTLIQTRFRDALPEDLASHPSIADYGDLEGLVKGHNSHFSLVGKRKEEMFPNDDWSEEQLNDFYKQLGWSDDPNNYNFDFTGEVEVPENFPNLQERIDAIKEYVIKAKIPPKQAKILTRELITKTIDNFNNNIKQYQQKNQEGWEKLKEEFGANFEKDLTKARGVLKKVMGEDVYKWFDETGISNEPMLAKAMIKIAGHFSEDTLGRDERPSQGVSPAQAKAKVRQMLADRKHPLNIAEHPNHDLAVSELNRLMLISEGVN